MPWNLWRSEGEPLLRDCGKAVYMTSHCWRRKIGRSEGAVKQKLKRMGALVVVTFSRISTTTSVALVNGLLTHEEASKVLSDTIEALRKPGLDKLEPSKKAARVFQDHQCARRSLGTRPCACLGPTGLC